MKYLGGDLVFDKFMILVFVFKDIKYKYIFFFFIMVLEDGDYIVMIMWI